MLTLTYGFQKPQSGDRSSALFTALEQNIQKVNDHTHDGANSPLLDAKNIQASSQALSSGNWVTYGGPAGFFRQLVTLPTGFLFDTVQFSFRLNGNPICLEVEKVSATTYYLYSNDSTISPTAVYGG